MKIVINLLLIVLLMSCKNNDSTIDSNSEQLSYEEIILKIVKSSNLDTELHSSYNTLSERIENDSIIIKVYLENDISDNPNEPRIVESAIAWLVLIPKRKKLFDITSDPKEPIDLIFNKNLCNEITKNEVYLNYKKESKNIENNKINFSDVFLEKSTVTFKPDDLEKTDDIEIQSFKKKLNTYLNENPEKKDFNIQNLLYLVNYETFSNSEGYIDSSWLNFFIKKYKIENSELVNLIDTIIEKEDFNALNVLIQNGYIFSLIQLEKANIVKSNSDQMKKINIENKGLQEDGDPTFYISENSKINKIIELVNYQYNSNKIYDKDGYTNLRENNSTNSKIILKINSGEHINVLDNTDSEWFLIETKNGKKGYIHKSRIVAE